MRTGVGQHPTPCDIGNTATQVPHPHFGIPLLVSLVLRLRARVRAAFLLKASVG